MPRLSRESRQQLEAKAIEELSKLGLTLLEPYKGRKVKHKMSCAKGHITEAKLSTKLSYKTGCRECANQRLSLNEAKALFESKGFTLLSDYLNMQTKVEVMCPEGHIVPVLPTNIIHRGNGCDECRKAMKGPSHYNWDDTITDEEREVRRNTPELKEWRKRVLREADYVCDCCERRGGELVAHHLYSYAKYKPLRTHPSNGVCLCEACHKRFHKLYGSGDNKMSQYIEFRFNFRLERMMAK